MVLLSDRQQQLLDWLRSRRLVSIQEIQERFSVSAPTAYRDVRALVEAGLALKTSEGVKIPAPPGRLRPEGQCFFCGGMLQERTIFLIQFSDGNQRSACCPHCGLLALGQPDVVSAMAGDYLYGRMVNARQAAYVVGSQISLCCEPSVLCFTSDEDARSFQQGFGGKVCGMDEAVETLQKLMRLGGT